MLRNRHHTAKERDEESGLYYYGARYYAPWACRFISIDPLAGSMPFSSPYSYAANNPVVLVDVDGLAPGGVTGGGGDGVMAPKTDPISTVPFPLRGTLTGDLLSRSVHSVGKTSSAIANKSHGYGLDMVATTSDFESKSDHTQTIGGPVVIVVSVLADPVPDCDENGNECYRPLTSDEVNGKRWNGCIPGKYRWFPKPDPYVHCDAEGNQVVDHAFIDGEYTGPILNKSYKDAYPDWQPPTEWEKSTIGLSFMPAIGGVVGTGSSLTGRTAVQSAIDYAVLESMNPVRSAIPRTVTALEAGGEIVIGTSGKHFPTVLSPLLGTPEKSLQSWRLLQCAEPKALNQMLLAGHARSEISIFTIGLNHGKSYLGKGEFEGMRFLFGRSIFPMAPCNNCMITTQGLKFGF